MKKSKNVVSVMKKDPPPKEELPNSLYISYNLTSEGGNIRQGEEDSPWPNHEDIYYHYTYNYATKTKPDAENGKIWGDWKAVPVSPEVFAKSKVYLAVLEYKDGGTFGSSYGHHSILGAYATRKEAELLLLENCDENFGYFGRLTDKLVVKLDIEE